ncbi:HNH endonuclease family protein [Nocardia wallacei]|uniref:HNH endonuclease family protein n=1 Tax=Nocardia wallacei TaxID=480035 RepID=UPI002458CF06|nr:HNH endonuclease family protein [Nocardia wallacei]
MKRGSRTSSPLRRGITLVAPVLLAVVLAGGYVLIDELGSRNDGKDPIAVAGKDVPEQLAKLVVAPEAAMTGYTREKFPHWDTNKAEHGFGAEFTRYERCETRDVMLLRDATGTVTLDPKTCKLTVGKDGGWRDQYGVLDRKSGQVKDYKWITDPSGVDAEHIVALAEAWRSGAASKDEDTRRRIANDAINLVAADPSANRSKGDQDPSDYLPPGTFRCAYLDRYVKVKIKYALTIDPDEQAALRTAVGDCVARGEFK